MLTTETVPKAWKAALAAVQTIAPEAVIAGGCLRDLDNGVPIKDIDIFVNGRFERDLNHLLKRLRNFDSFSCQDYDPEDLYPVGDGNDVVGYFEAMYDDCLYPLQIIMVNFDCAKITERCDYGICRISFDGKALFRHPDYERGKRSMQFHLCMDRGDEGLAASVHRFARLSKKYPGWRFVPYSDPKPLFPDNF